MKKAVVDEHRALVQGALEQWLTFKKFVLLAFSKEEISAEAEAQFLEIKSAVARNLRTLSERVKEGGVDYGDKIIRELLNKCVSASSVRALPENDKRGLYKQWHTAFIRLSRSVGALKFMSEGYVPPVGAKGKKGAAAKGGKSEAGGGSKGVIIAVVVVVLLIGAGAAAYFMGLLPI